MFAVETLFDLSHAAVIYCDTTVWVKSPTERTAAGLAVLPIPEREPDRFCFSNHMNGTQGYDGIAIFFRSRSQWGCEKID